MAGNSDKDLLARLNALKPSAIDLDKKLGTPSVPAPDETDDIAHRFLGLRSRTEHESTQEGHMSDLTEAGQEDDEDIDDMLEELRSLKKSTWLPGDDRKIRNLLMEAQSALADVNSDSDSDDDGAAKDADTRQKKAKPGNDGSEEKDQHDENKSQADEDVEAGELLAQILAEVQLNASKAGKESFSDSDCEEAHKTPHKPAHKETGDEAFDQSLFPTTPSKEPEVSAPAPDDSLNLPSAPTAAPVTPKSKTAAKKDSDDDVETWCEICLTDAEVRCLGCDNDLYCVRCWKEAHTGPSAGYEERTHRCVQYSKPGPQPAAA